MIISERSEHDAVNHPNDGLFTRLQARAAIHGRTVAEEAQALLTAALPQPPEPPVKLGSAIHALFSPLGGVRLTLPERDAQREPPIFSESDK